MNRLIFVKKLLFIAIIVWMYACKNNEATVLSGAETQYYCVQQLTDVIVYDINNPPVAGRMYAYSNLAFYEAFRPSNAKYASLLPKLKGFETLAAVDPSITINYPLSAAVAFMKVAETLVFSKDSIRVARESLLKKFDGVSNDVQSASVKWGETVAAVILKKGLTRWV